MTRPYVVSCLLAVVLSAGIVRSEGRAGELQFNRDIRPILADKCFRCHGVDQGSRQGDLRLDQREDAIRAGAIQPGKPDESELWRRVTTAGDERMPPPASGLHLEPRERDLLREWINAGAPYEPHWAFAAPKRRPTPEVDDPAWRGNPIDAWVFADLRSRGVTPSPPSDRATLLRRLSLALTGLPPTLAELDDFLGDARPDAVTRVVDRLLSSPHYAERMTMDWMDAARYADTNGYFQDLERTAWPWRDWVLRAFQHNMPFDQFTREQLAGDLLPQATLDQRVATGFHRNHMVTNETGIIEEEYRVSYVADRVETTGTVWLGLTLGCARCHDHKYDPVNQADFYRLFAFFNSIDESGLVRGSGSPPPVVSLATEEQQRSLQELQARKKALREELAALEPQLAAEEEQWLKATSFPTPSLTGLAAHVSFDGEVVDQGPRHWSVRAVGETTFSPGVRGNSAQYDIGKHHQFDGPRLESDEPFSMSVWVKPGSTPVGYVLTKMDEHGAHRGLEVNWYKSMPRISLVHTWRRNAVEVQSADTVAGGAWHHLVITYDGSSRAAGVKMFIDGQPQLTTIRRDDLTGSINTAAPWSIAYKSAGLGWDGSLDELRWYDRILSSEDVKDLYWHDLLRGAAERPPADRLPLHRDRLRAYYLAHASDGQARRTSSQLEDLERSESELSGQITSTAVMRELDNPRDTHVLVRGQYDQPGTRVEPGFPAAFTTAGQPESTPRRLTRLDLANWLVSPENPLTARVLVNRYWQLLFGEGLVRTPNDLGVQGELPSHPELLDWLAVDFRESGWDIKRLIKQMATSQTFQQASAVRPDLAERDPDNRWLARGPRFRLSGELLRDQALSVGGLLVSRMGGPSVKPYQPPGLWEEVSYNADQTYDVDRGSGRYRRSLYTFWKRQAPPPGILTFDGPTRESCVVRRPRTNTPLQALVLLNDQTFVEAARNLALQLLRERHLNDRARLQLAFRQVVGRLPEESELKPLERFLVQQRDAYQSRPAEAERLLATDGAAVATGLDRSEWASWTLLAGVLLNLDEAVTIQ